MTDPYQLQWNLKPKVEALRAEAKSARSELLERYKTSEIELAVQRDKAARDQYSAEQGVKSGEIQLKVEQRDAARQRELADEWEASAAAAEKAGDRGLAQERREGAEAFRIEAETHDARARQIEIDTSDLKLEVANLAHRRDEIAREREDITETRNKAEAQVDKIEQQADLYAEARTAYGQASMAGDDVGQRSTFEVQAEDLVAKANGITVDRDVIRAAVPEFPDATPGFDDPAPPLPEGAEDPTATSSADDAPLPATGDDLGLDQPDLEVDAVSGVTATDEAGDGAEVDPDLTPTYGEEAPAEYEPEYATAAAFTETDSGFGTDYDDSAGSFGAYDASESTSTDADVYSAPDEDFTA